VFQFQPLSGEQYRLLVESSPMMVWRSGTDGLCDYFNGTWLRFTGRTLEQEVGNGWSEGVHPEDRPRCVATYCDHFARRAPFELVYRLKRHDGVYRHINDRGVPCHDADGSFGGFVGECLDIEERMVAEQANVRFLAMMAHELRTPLTSLRIYLEALRRQVARGDPVEGVAFTRFSRQIERFAGLVDEIADTARFGEGRAVNLELLPVDLGQLAREAVELARESLALYPRGARGHMISLRVPPGLFPVRGDAQRLEQVLSQVIDNAVKFSPSGGPVDVELRTAADEHSLVVEDQGIGIPEAELGSITNRFSRASNASPDHFPGIGMGLATSREIIEGHGGTLAIESALGRGTRLTIKLPAELPLQS
jgi:PAS domain S-box-containing protein